MNLKTFLEVSDSSDNDEMVNKINEKLHWIEKYRPQKIEQVLSNENIISILKKMIRSNNMQHLLLYGPSGTGKTSAIITSINEIYGSINHNLILNLNASDKRGIDIVRMEIMPFLRSEITKQNKFKLVILDEVDALTIDAQSILKMAIEEATNTYFCLICNNINKIDIALQSRCKKFRFSFLTYKNMKTKLIDICENEKIAYNDDNIDLLVNLSKGDMRKAINLLQITYLTFNNIKNININKSSNNCDKKTINIIFDILIDLNNKKLSIKDAYCLIQKIILKQKILIINLVNDIQNKVLEVLKNPSIIINIIDGLAKMEIYISNNINLKMQIIYLVSIFN